MALRKAGKKERISEVRYSFVNKQNKKQNIFAVQNKLTHKSLGFIILIWLLLPPEIRIQNYEKSCWAQKASWGW